MAECGSDQLHSCEKCGASTDNRPPDPSKVVAQAYDRHHDYTFLKKNRVFSVLLVGGDCFFIAMQVGAGWLGGRGGVKLPGSFWKFLLTKPPTCVLSRLSHFLSYFVEGGLGHYVRIN